MTWAAASIMDPENERVREGVRRIINNLTAAKGLAQLLERMAAALPEDEREKWIERLQAIVTAVNLATIELGLLTDNAVTSRGDD